MGGGPQTSEHSRQGRPRPDASPSELLDDLLGRAIREGASDIHIESCQDDVDVRIRVDGVL